MSISRSCASPSVPNNGKSSFPSHSSQESSPSSRLANVWVFSWTWIISAPNSDSKTPSSFSSNTVGYLNEVGDIDTQWRDLPRTDIRARYQSIGIEVPEVRDSKQTRAQNKRREKRKQTESNEQPMQTPAQDASLSTLYRERRAVLLRRQVIAARRERERRDRVRRALEENASPSVRRTKRSKRGLNGERVMATRSVGGK